MHSYAVLYRAGATSPLLALAMARAVFLRRLFASGPQQLLHMLHAHWTHRPANSWLQMLRLDIQVVAVYSSAAQLLQDMPCPVTALLEAVHSDPAWWPAQVKQAVRGFGLELHRWSQTPAVAAAAAVVRD